MDLVSVIYFEFCPILILRKKKRIFGSNNNSVEKRILEIIYRYEDYYNNDTI
jgi:hypothetical protein